MTTQTLLSGRQMEVLPLIVAGKSNKEIGSELGISELTAKNHIQAILRKLSCRNRIAVMYAALRKGLIDPPSVEPAPAQAIIVVHPSNPLPEPAPLPPKKWLEDGGIRVCWETMEVEIDGEQVRLTASAFKLLHFFLLNQHRAHSRQTLIDHSLSTDAEVEERTIDVHIRRLRIDLEAHGYPDKIETVRSIGYRWRVG